MTASGGLIVTGEDAATYSEPDLRMVMTEMRGGNADLSGLRSPAEVEDLGMALTGKIRDAIASDIDVVLTWEELDDVLLGHVVAREVGARLALSYLDEGIVELAEPLPPGARVALVSRAFTQVNSVRAAAAAVGHFGAALVIAACLRGTDVLDNELPPGIPRVVLGTSGQ